MEEAFSEAARGMFALMVELSSVTRKTSIDVICCASSTESLLVDWLAELIAQKDLHHCVFVSFKVQIGFDAGQWRLRGRCEGDIIDPERHRLGTEVKGISVAGLRVGEEDGRWVAECIVDV